MYKYSWGRPLRLKKQVTAWMLAMGRFHKLIYALCQTICALRPTFEKLFTGAKVQRKAQKISVERKTVYEIDPSTYIFENFET